MKRYVAMFGMLAICLVLAGASPSTVRPPASVNVYGGGGGWGGGWGGGGGTVAGNAMNGMANMMSARGNMNLSNSAAAINYTAAQSQYIQNRQQATDAYFDMRATNRAATAAERGPHLTMEQLARIAADGAPRPISPSEMDPVTGGVNWPVLLQQDAFADDRKTVEDLLAKRASYGRLGFSDQKAAQDAVDSMFGKLKAQIKDVPPQDYTNARSFLRSLIFSLSRAELS